MYIYRICRKPVFSQGSVRVQRRVTLVRRSLVSIKHSSGAAPGLHNTGSPSSLSSPFLTLPLPQSFFYGAVCTWLRAAAPATPGMSLVAVTLAWPPQGCPWRLSPLPGCPRDILDGCHLGMGQQGWLPPSAAVSSGQQDGTAG